MLLQLRQRHDTWINFVMLMVDIPRKNSVGGPLDSILVKHCICHPYFQFRKKVLLLLSLMYITYELDVGIGCLYSYVRKNSQDDVMSLMDSCYL